MENPAESDWGGRKTDESLDTTKDSWESNASKNDDKGSNKKISGSSSSPQEQSGWGAEPKTKDTGGWGTSSSNYEEVENWGITQPENEGKAPTNDKENKSNRRDGPIDNNKEMGNTENSATNEISGTSEGTRDTGWDPNPEDKVNDNWGTPNQDQNDTWNDEGYDDQIKSTSDWVSNQQDYPNDYQRREDDRPRGGRVGRGGRGSHGGRGGYGGRERGRGGRSGRGRDNFRRDQENDYRGHSHRPSTSRGGRNQNNERHDSFNENERNEKERESKFANKKHGGLYDSMHAPKPESDAAVDSADTARSVPYVNEHRVLSGGLSYQKKTDEEMDEIMGRIRKRNQEIEEKRKIVVQDELNFQKDEEVRKKKELENKEIQRRKREEEEEEKKRHEFQMLRLQKELDEERERNATNKSKSRDNREWDSGKRDSDWNNTHNPRNNPRGGYRNGSRDENPYRNGSQNDNRDYDRRGPYGNEHGERSYRGRGRGDRRGDRGGDRGGGDRGGDRGRRRGSGSRGGRGGGRRYSDQHKDSSNKSEEAFGSGNSWAEQTEQQEKDINWDNEMERENNAPNTEASDNWGPVDKAAERHGWD